MNERARSRLRARLATLTVTAFVVVAASSYGGQQTSPPAASAPRAPAELDPARAAPPVDPQVSRNAGRPVQAFDPRTVTVALTGDVLVHNGVWETAERDAARHGGTLPDFGPVLAGVRPLISPADLAICHLETPLSQPAGPYSNYPLFSAPPTVLDGLVRAGFDGCTTASNHAVDQGFDGLVRTLGALDRRDLAHTGTFASRRQARQPLVLEVDGVRIGLVSLTYGTNGMPVEKPWSVNLIDVPRTIAQAEHMHRQGADVVMVAVHAGDEYSHAPNAQQVQVFDALTRSRYVDFVYGHHAHVVQPFARVNEKWVLYGLGNFVAQQPPEIPDTYRAIVAGITIRERRDGTFQVVSPRYATTVITDPSSTGATRVLDARGVLDDERSPLWQRSLARAGAAAVNEVMARPGVSLLDADAKARRNPGSARH